MKRELIDLPWKLMMIPVFNWKWTTDGGKDKWNPIYVQQKSPKIINWRYLTGNISQQKKNYIDYPSLSETKAGRVDNIKPRQPTAEEYKEWNPVLQIALEKDD